jgi:hypothetical protein
MSKWPVRFWDDFFESGAGSGPKTTEPDLGYIAELQIVPEFGSALQRNLGSENELAVNGKVELMLTVGSELLVVEHGGAPGWSGVDRNEHFGLSVFAVGANCDLHAECSSPPSCVDDCADV